MDSGGRLKDLKDKMAKEVFGVTGDEARKDSICVACKRPIWDRIYSNEGMWEYRSSGLCEKCFDDITGG